MRLVAALLLLASVVAAPELDRPPLRSLELPPGVKLQPVARRAFSTADDISALLTKARTAPLVLTGTPADGWPIMGWEPAALEGKLSDNGALPGVKLRRAGDDNRFLYQLVTGERGNYPGWSSPFDSVPMSGAEFFAKAAESGAYMQFSGSLRLPELAALGAELPPPAELSALAAGDQTPGATAAASASGAHVTPMVWMGSANATTSLHYDCAHNTYIQIHGRKRFLLLPPKLTSGVPTFPEAHPSNRQARPAAEPADAISDLLTQALGENGAAKLGTRKVPMAVTEAVLDRGDVLLLPAHWLHYVSAIDTSVSVNLWTQAKEELTMNR